MKFIYKKTAKTLAYDLCYFQASLVARMVLYAKELPTMWETQIRFLGWEDALEK